MTTLRHQDFPDSTFGEFTPATTKCRCPKCRSADLVLIEAWEGTMTWTVRNGRLNRKAGFIEPGSPTRIEAQCSKCGHEWRVRKALQLTDVVTELDLAQIHKG